MILSATFSKPVKNISEILGDEYTRVKIKLLTASLASAKNENYFAEFYTQKQVFHKKFSQSQLEEFIQAHAGTTFKSCVQRTESEEITILSNKKGKITTLSKPLKTDSATKKIQIAADGSKKKNYCLPEGTPVPFLVHLGIMTAEGKVINSKYDKFRQINRFLEFVDDVLPDVLGIAESKGTSVSEHPFNIVDFGSGKSYLTFAVQYYLTEIKHIPCNVFGLDLKKDVIQYCNQLAEKLGLKNIAFKVGNIADFDENKHPDIIITLHACDTATDYALDYAIKHNAGAILSVPCCQHEINSQLATGGAKGTVLEPLLKYGLIKERFSALLTDAVRGQLLESAGYKVQMLEFIDENATPKNLLIRAVKKSSSGGTGTGVETGSNAGAASAENTGSGAVAGSAAKILSELGLEQTLAGLLK
ncbi:MAG: SAM-dependent methyltransferase [Treponema sp.]|nr:SAM-dependent methyltransferase [Candidatus Treponema equifaecale]